MNIVIVGGGSSGWLVASGLLKTIPGIQITLIETEKINPIGVGESTTGIVKFFINKVLEISDEEFMPGVSATYKNSVLFKNFLYKDDPGIHYPLSKPSLEDIEEYGIHIWDIVTRYKTTLSRFDYVKYMYPSYHLFSQNLIPINKTFFNFDLNIDSGYNFDANLLGPWLKNNFCQNQVTVINKEVVEVNSCQYVGIQSIILEDGSKIEHHIDNPVLFIDCSGFNQLLISELNPEVVNLSEKLLNNSSWVCPITYTDPYSEMQPFTTATAIDHGWCWYTPIFSRTGNGYVYSDNYVSDEQALEEFKDYLIDIPIQLTENEIENLPFRNIKYQTKYLKNPFIKNVVAIGLSSGFLEPLEGTGIHLIIEQIFKLIKILEGAKINQFDRDSFNQYSRNIFDGWSDILFFIYAYNMKKIDPHLISGDIGLPNTYWKDSAKYFSEHMEELDLKSLNYGYLNFVQRFLSNVSNGENYDIYSVFSKSSGANGDSFSTIYQKLNSHWNKDETDYEAVANEYYPILENRKSDWENYIIHHQNKFQNMYTYLLNQV